MLGGSRRARSVGPKVPRCQGAKVTKVQGPSGLKGPRGDLWAHVPCVLLGCAMDTDVKV